MNLPECLSVPLRKVSHVSLSDRIACGLDRLQWDRVSEMLEQVFKHAHISITIYTLPNTAGTTAMK